MVSESLPNQLLPSLSQLAIALGPLKFNPFFSLTLFLFIIYFIFNMGFSLCSLDWPGTSYVEPSNLKLRDPHPSASLVLGLQACATVPDSF